ncbi:protein phosphatase CheZ [Nisaea acidiphila]|uniref:Protein phosphatase CheZ n=1 Tax=Nisaea acidiphila TaxID=1862145 RepID=A0A9J7AWK9_9PROT|nr:protein phosphatase CheZ [Nisaea acidiphila]UUX51751.1 protein phosphatase CheZ [Nisaea acidiphila]
MGDAKGKLFSVERRAQQRGGSSGPVITPKAVAPGLSSTAFEEALLAEVSSLRTELSEIRKAIGMTGVTVPVTETPAVEETVAEAAPVDESDVDHDLRIEIAQMVRSIGRAKSQIAAIKHPMSAEDQMQTASLQLDTIVQTTENATNEIMSSVDSIEGTLKQIHGFTLDDPEVQQLIDQASNQLISIIEACSFQDLTGQRINQVVKTLRFIESRILAMIDIWGGLEAFKDLPIPKEEGEEEAGEEDDLLNGPALGSAGLSQEDIDALFD